MRKCIVFISFGVIGMTLLILGIFNVINPFCIGTGTALIAVCVQWMVRMYRYKRDATYAQQVDVAVNDERNGFIRSKAWAWTGYLFVLIAAVLTIVLRVLGQALLSMVCGGAVCLMVLLYCISYFILRKKY